MGATNVVHSPAWHVRSFCSIDEQGTHRCLTHARELYLIPLRLHLCGLKVVW